METMDGQPKVSRRALGLAALVAVPAIAAARDTGAPATGAANLVRMLLSPLDFPAAGLKVAQHLGERETNDGGRTAQVVLEDGRIKLFHSVVVFPSDRAAQSAFAALRQFEGGTALEVVPAPVRYGDESVVLRGPQGRPDSVSLALRRGRTLSKLTLQGTGDPEELTGYVRKVEEKLK